MAERIARMEEWAEGHEYRCEDRQMTQGREIGQLKDVVNGLTKGAWCVAASVILQLLAVVAFLLTKALHWA